MATSSITKKFVIRDDKAAERFIKIVTEQKNEEKRANVSSDVYEEGKKTLRQALGLYEMS